MQLSFVLILRFSQKVWLKHSRYQQKVPHPITLFTYKVGRLFVRIQCISYFSKGSFSDRDWMTPYEHLMFSDIWKQLSNLFQDILRKRFRLSRFFKSNSTFIPSIATSEAILAYLMAQHVINYIFVKQRFNRNSIIQYIFCQTCNFLMSQFYQIINWLFDLAIQYQLFITTVHMFNQPHRVSHLEPSTLEEIQKKRLYIQRIKINHQEKLEESNNQVKNASPIRQHQHTSTLTQPQANTQINKLQTEEKNKGVSDTDRMLFDKKFKNYLNHRQEYLEKARKRCTSTQVQNKTKTKQLIDLGEAEYYNQEEVLSNTGSEYQYKDADDMQAAYEQMTTGKKPKGGQLQLFHCQLYQNQFRQFEFENLLVQASQDEQSQASISKDRLLNYLFDQPIVMMLYSINPYQLGDQLAQFQTKNLDILNFQEFSLFLLTDREPTYFQYTHQNLTEARALGRGIKCSPIIAKWIDETGIYDLLIDTFKSIDMRGNGRVDRIFLAKKLFKQASTRRITQVEVIQIVNISKNIPLNRLLYQIQFQERGDNPEWSYDEFVQFLTHYKRRRTPQKDRLITKLIMAGKYDSSYVYIISQEALQVVKNVFQSTPKFAQYFVLKEKFIQNLCKDPLYKKLQGMWVRSQSNRYVKRQTFQDTLVRMLAEGQTYLDLEQILDFLTNRGRPKLVQYRVYIENLERQMAIIEQQQSLKRQKYGENYEGSSTDEEFNQIVNQKRIKRKKDKILQIRNSNNFQAGKKFNVTIPVPFEFDSRDKKKKLSIREQKLKEMLAQKEKQFIEACKPIKVKQVPDYVKQNLYQKMLKDQQRQRKERLQKFRLQIMSQVHVSDRLMRPLSDQQHCDFTSSEYKFTARPMPWYCEVNLMDRINKKKQERRQRILQEIITRNTDYDLPEGVQRMMERQEERQRKKADKIRTASTGSLGQCTFIPKISYGVPDFKTIHEHLHFDLQNAKNVKEPITIAPFSFENRPYKSRTTYQPQKVKQNKPIVRHSQYQKAQNEEDYHKIPKTEKFQALVQLRRRQLQEKKKQEGQQLESQAVRKLRSSKFAPVVWRALKNSTIDPSKSRAIVAERIKQFKRDQRRKKQEYENQMIRILTKVYERPLLLQSQFAENQENQESPKKNQRESNINKSKAKKQQNRNREQYLEDQAYPLKNRKNDLKLNLDKRRPPHPNYDEQRRRAIEQHHPGQYPPEGYDPDYEEEEGEEDFHESQMYGEEYEQGNLHTS